MNIGGRLYHIIRKTCRICGLSWNHAKEVGRSTAAGLERIEGVLVEDIDSPFYARSQFETIKAQGQDKRFMRIIESAGGHWWKCPA